MPLDFPTSPTNGQEYNGYVYSTSVGAWQAKPAAQSPFYTSDTPPSNPVAGDAWFNTNDGTMYIYYNDGNTSQWTEHRSEIARSQVGLVPVRPASITLGSGTGSVDVNGNVNFSGASSVSFNNVFSSSYTNYKITMSLSLASGAQLTYLRMRSNTTDNTGLYVWGYGGYRITGPAVNWTSSSNSTAGICVLNAGATGPQTTSIDMFNPFPVGPVTTWNVGGYWADSTSSYGSSGAGLHADGASFNGFSIYPGGSTISGTIKVYGYN